MNMRTRLLRTGCWLSIMWLLSACGWHLQGMYRVPEYVVPLYLDLTDIHSPFAESLREHLHRAGISVTEDRNRASAVLRVSTDDSSHKVSSVSALNEPQQYEVYYKVEYRLDKRAPDAPNTISATSTTSTVKAGSINLLTLQTLNSTRTMTYDKTLALAKQREEQFLRATLATELADQVMRRLSMLPPSEPVPSAEVSAE